MKKVVGTILSCLIIFTCLSVNICADNVKETITLTSNSATINKDGDEKDYVIDLNGFNVSGASSNAIKMNTVGSSLLIKGTGNVTNNSSSNSTVICSGDLTIEGGVYKNNKSFYCISIDYDNVNLFIKGGTFNNPISFQDDTNVIVTGGTFTENALESIKSKIPSDYVYEKVSDEPKLYTVFHKHGDTKYTNLLDYLNNVGSYLESGNYYLPGDLDIDKPIYVVHGKNVNICFNGYDLRQTSKTNSSGITINGSINIDNCKHETNDSNYSYNMDTNGGDVALFVEETGSLTINNLTIVLNDDIFGIENDKSTTLRNCAFKTTTADTEINAAISNGGTLKLIDTTITGIKTNMGAVLNSDTLIVGGKTKIINNTCSNIDYKGQNVINYFDDDPANDCEGRISIAFDDDAPNLNEMKIGVTRVETDDTNSKNIDGPFCFNASASLLNCFSSDLDEYIVNFDIKNDSCLELIPKPIEKKAEEKAEPKDETCEAVIGKDWTWDETLGVCKLKGYRAVNTATN